MFPPDTVKFANQRAERIRQSLHQKGKDVSPQNLAEELYSHESGIKFGYWEAVQQGKWFRYPHEIQSQAECGEQAVYRYVVAKSLGLRPRLFWLEGIADAHWVYPGPSSHLVVDVEADGERIVTDPLFSLYGPAELSPTGIYLKQKPVDGHPEENPLRKRLEIKAGSLVQLSEADILAQIKELRKPKGLLKMLMAYPMLVNDVVYEGDEMFPSLTSDVVVFNPASKVLTIFVTAAESSNHHSRWRRDYTYGKRGVEVSDAISDVSVDSEGKRMHRETQLKGNLEDMPWVSVYMEYRKAVREKAGKSGRNPSDTYLTPAVDKLNAEPNPNADMMASLLSLPPPAELKKLPEAMQRVLKRRADISGFDFDIDDVEPPTQEMLDEYIRLKFPIEKFQPHLEKGDYLAGRVKKVL